MKKTHSEGFTLMEVLIAIVVLGIVVVPICSSLLVSFRVNAKTDELLQAQLAVSSAAEQLMAEGIVEENLTDYGRDGDDDRFPDVIITTKLAAEGASYYDVTITHNTDTDVFVITKIRGVSASEGGGI